ncbi:hypothetical protein, partial [Mycobacterium sp.]|uniref:hypothetical protein n=1 Tax=Mycobacterium sp. TaxID=1785 RepID=UPI003F9818AD
PVSKAAKVRMVSSTLRPTAVSLIVACLRFPSGSITPTPSLYVVAAQTSGTQASCEIMINGNVIMHTSGVGALECNSLFD